MKKKKVKPTIPTAEEVKVKSYLDMIAPSVVKFNPDHFICGNTRPALKNRRSSATWEKRMV